MNDILVAGRQEDPPPLGIYESTYSLESTNIAIIMEVGGNARRHKACL